MSEGKKNSHVDKTIYKALKSPGFVDLTKLYS